MPRNTSRSQPDTFHRSPPAGQPGLEGSVGAKPSRQLDRGSPCSPREPRGHHESTWEGAEQGDEQPSLPGREGTTSCRGYHCPSGAGAGAGAGGGGGSGETCPERGNFLKFRRLLVPRGDAWERAAWPGSAAARCAAAGGSSSYGRWREVEQVRRAALRGRWRGLNPEPSRRGGRGTAGLPGGRGRCPVPATERPPRLVPG